MGLGENTAGMNYSCVDGILVNHVMHYFNQRFSIIALRCSGMRSSSLRLLYSSFLCPSRSFKDSPLNTTTLSLQLRAARIIIPWNETTHSGLWHVQKRNIQGCTMISRNSRLVKKIKVGSRHGCLLHAYSESRFRVMKEWRINTDMINDGMSAEPVFVLTRKLEDSALVCVSNQILICVSGY